MASRADVVATAAIPAVVVTTEALGRYASTKGTSSHSFMHIFLSTLNLYPLTRSLPLCDRSPILCALGSGHSISFAVVGGVVGGEGVSISGASSSPVSTPSGSS